MIIIIFGDIVVVVALAGTSFRCLVAGFSRRDRFGVEVGVCIEKIVETVVGGGELAIINGDVAFVLIHKLGQFHRHHL